MTFDKKTVPPKVLGRRIREGRLKANLTQAELARECKCVRAQVGRWEIGTTRPDLQNLYRLSRALAIPFEELTAPDPAHIPKEDAMQLYKKLSVDNQRLVVELMRALK